MATGEGRWAEAVMLCAASSAAFSLARKLVRPRGKILLKGSLSGETPVDLAGLMVDEVRLIGSRCGPFAPALRLLAGGGVTVQPLIRQVRPLGEGGDAMRERGGMRNLLSVAREALCANDPKFGSDRCSN
ncbi:MAG: hypothetical protein HQL51_00615 [Magnetococcales bacterium]|nr:hypothetical protein [Magnetococcales bacterium]